MGADGTDGVNEKRLVDTFIGLVKIDSPSKREKRMAEHVRQRLADLGLEVRSDDAGSTFGGEAGNVYGALRANPGGHDEGGRSRGDSAGAGRTPLLCAHMDTVRAAPGLEPQVRGGVIYSDGKNILAADDKAGVAAILEALTVVRESGRPHGDLRVLFTVGEEIGLFGARGAPDRDLGAGLAFVFDSGSEVGTVIVDTPTEVDLTIRVIGQAAHAGVEPEKGINAIHVAARAMAALPTGRLDPETTLNFGVIHGGVATNIVPEDVEIEMETRSRNRATLDRLVAQVEGAFKDQAGVAGARVEIKKVEAYRGFKLSEKDEVVQVAMEAIRQIALEPRLSPRGGGSDANILNLRGVPAVNLGAGYNDDHTSRENIPVDQLVRAARLVLAIIDVLAVRG